METISERSDSKVYEIGYILLSSIPEEKVSSEVESLKALLAKHKATIIAEGQPQLTTLAYTMVKKIGSVNRRFNQGYFGWIKYEAPVESANALNKAVQETEEVLRHILINTVRENTNVAEIIALNTAEQDAEGKTEELDKSVAPVAAADLSA